MYHLFRQLWLVLGVKLIGLISNLFSRWLNNDRLTTHHCIQIHLNVPYPTLFQQFDIQLDVTETEIPHWRGYFEIACEIYGDKLIQPVKNWCITGQTFEPSTKMSRYRWFCGFVGIWESTWSSRSFRAFSSLASLCFTNSTLPQGRKPQSPHFSQSYCSWAK